MRGATTAGNFDASFRVGERKEQRVRATAPVSLCCRAEPRSPSLQLRFPDAKSEHAVQREALQAGVMKEFLGGGIAGRSEVIRVLIHIVCAGGELTWAFIPALSLTAGAKYRHFFDMYDDLAVAWGISYNLLVGGAQAAKPATQRVLPPEAHPQPPPKPEALTIEKLSRFLTPKESAVLLLSNQIISLVGPNVNPAIDKNLQVAIGLALRPLGIAYVSPPLASCAAASKNRTALGSAKCPLQTLQGRSRVTAATCRGQKRTLLFACSLRVFLRHDQRLFANNHSAFLD